MHKFYIQGDKVQKMAMKGQMLMDVTMPRGSETEQERMAKTQRRSRILERIIFKDRNTYLNNESVADNRLELAIQRQLPS